MTLKEQTKAPDFKLNNQDGKEVSLKDYRDRWVLVYFYPKDDTPGCTVEAKTMQANMKKFNALNFSVLGISPDGVESHRKFADKYKLKFDLLADAEREVVNLYGVWGKKKFMGREYMGVNRSSFLIDPKGKIAKIYPKVKPDKHAQEVYEDVQKLSGEN